MSCDTSLRTHAHVGDQHGSCAAVIDILLVEDNPGDARMVREMVRDSPELIIHHVERLGDGIEHLAASKVDVVLLDLGLPDSQGLDTLRTLLATGCSAPVVVLTGHDDDVIGQAAVRDGAQDYLVKGRVIERVLNRAVRYAIERGEAQSKLQRLNQVLRAVRDIGGLIVRETDPSRLIQQASDLLVETRGYRAVWVALTGSKGPPSLMAQSGWGECFVAFSDALRKDWEPCCFQNARATAKGLLVLSPHETCGTCPLLASPSYDRAVVALLRHDGSEFGMLGVSLAPGVPLGESEVTLLGELAADLGMALHGLETEEARQKLEEQLIQSQKMDSIGRLAGGVAHDFNNLLSVILCNTAFALDSSADRASITQDLLEIQSAGQRAAALTRQLLAFGRKQILQQEPLNLNQIALGVEKMLRRIIGEDIELVQVHAPDLGLVIADAGQIEQVIMNLVVNARDAMTEGGRLTLETANIELGEQHATSDAGFKPGPHVRLSVTDTGRGMDDETCSRAFEPFFTTKEKGKGTGLGLSTVYGIVRQSGGNVRVKSEPGRGTRFDVFLPRSPDTTAPAAEPVARPRKATGTETILLVEDEDAVRNLARRIIGAAGYSVLMAANGAEALQLAERHPGEIHLLLTDVVMPNMGGRVLANKFTALRPNTKVLYMSGYTDDAIIHHGVLEPGTQFVAKPFSATDLTQKIREVLEGSTMPPTAQGAKP